MNIHEVKMKNPGILVSEIPTDTYNELLNSCDQQIKNKNISAALKRNLVVDYDVQGIEECIHTSIPKSYNDYLCDFALEYAKYYKLDINYKPVVSSQWLNLQKKYEYRPLHCHSTATGNNLSFVTYVKIPYNLNSEDKVPNHSKKATRFRNGRIEFIINTFTGNQLVHTLDIDSNFEGKTILFLDSFMHIVYPFYTSEEYRISLAGNIKFN